MEKNFEGSVYQKEKFEYVGHEKISVSKESDHLSLIFDVGREKRGYSVSIELHPDRLAELCLLHASTSVSFARDMAMALNKVYLENSTSAKNIERKLLPEKRLNGDQCDVYRVGEK